MGTLQIDVLGTSFAIKANEDDEYLKKLLGYYQRISDEIATGGLKDPLQIAVMSGIMLCDELYKEKSKAAQTEHASSEKTADNEAERLTLEMIDKIDKVLQ